MHKFKSPAYICISKCMGGFFMYSGQTRPTVEYDRQIRYLDYMENGQRCRGAGFVKLERSDGRCNISLQISGLYRKDCFTRPLYLLCGNEERELCKLQLANGGIKTYLEGLNSHDLDGQGLDYNRLTGLRIPISECKEIQCQWAAPESRRNHMERNSVKSTEYSPEQQPQLRAEADSGTGGRQAPEQEMRMQEQAERIRDSDRQIDMTAAEPAVSSEQNGSFQEEEKPASTAFREDKWEQLWAIYPHINPFSDEREYLSLGPSDFVILPGRYYKLVNNSFLLHGYYNYHHLILTRVRQRNSLYYYIGVPGNLYQREKKIAIMFGFEGFECAAEPAGEGAFGYYLIPVEL